MRGRPPKLHLSKSMRIWVDADSCPKAIKEILFRTADRRRIAVTLVGAQPNSWPNSAFIRSITVLPGFDAADQKISLMVSEGDLVVTSDVALASSVIDKKALAMSPRGEQHTRDQVRQRMAERGFMPVARGAGIVAVKDSSSAREQLAFTNLIEVLLTKAEPVVAVVPAKAAKPSAEAVADTAEA